MPTGMTKPVWSPEDRDTDISVVYLLPGANVGLVEPDSSLWRLDMAEIQSEYPVPVGRAHRHDTAEHGVSSDRGGW